MAGEQEGRARLTRPPWTTATGGKLELSEFKASLAASAESIYAQHKMKSTRTESFEAFAVRFVRCYWETVKSQKFSMPPDEPVEESIEEILTAVTSRLEKFGSDHVLVMMSGDWAWWRYSFRSTVEGWMITAGSARSLDPDTPHNLLAPPYERWFRPFLNCVTQIAQDDSGETS